MDTNTDPRIDKLIGAYKESAKAHRETLDPLQKKMETASRRVDWGLRSYQSLRDAKFEVAAEIEDPLERHARFVAIGTEFDCSMAPLYDQKEQAYTEYITAHMAATEALVKALETLEG